jgi:hypothetical protein
LCLPLARAPTCRSHKAHYGMAEKEIMRMPASPRRQIWTYQVAAFVQAVCIASGAVAVKLIPPFHHVCLAAVFLDELAAAVAALHACSCSDPGPSHWHRTARSDLRKRWPSRLVATAAEARTRCLREPFQAKNAQQLTPHSFWRAAESTRNTTCRNLRAGVVCHGWFLVHQHPNHWRALKM